MNGDTPVATLLNTFGEHEDPSEAAGLEELREEEVDEEYDENADDRTRLKKDDSKQQLNGNGRQNGSRIQSHSPIPSRSSSTDDRISKAHGHPLREMWCENIKTC
ncbi:hypothetical protein H2248_004055 [Termitomyces sp. 'cryptogamus']|nr:hypothetical protein H2248_004055 [Termitomyces sp. 'cryptogamus']